MESIFRKHPVSSGAQEVLVAMLARASTLAAEGLAPRRDLGQCLKSLGPVLSFIASQPALSALPALGSDARWAVLRIAQEFESSALPPLAVSLPLSIEHEEAIRTGVLLLAAYRAAIEGAQGERLSAALAGEFGIGSALQIRDGAKVADGIARFLSAAGRHPEVVLAAKLTARQLAGLESQERVLRSHLAQRQKQSVTPGLPQRVLILRLSIEHFLDRFEAALRVRMPASLPSLPDSPGSHACRLTQSGRLVFN